MAILIKNPKMRHVLARHIFEFSRTPNSRKIHGVLLIVKEAFEFIDGKIPTFAFGSLKQERPSRIFLQN